MHRNATAKRSMSRQYMKSAEHNILLCEGVIKLKPCMSKKMTCRFTFPALKPPKPFVLQTGLKLKDAWNAETLAQVSLYIMTCESQIMCSSSKPPDD